MRPEIVATPGELEVNDQPPTELDVGGVKSTFEMLSLEKVIFVNVPSVGATAVIVRSIVVFAVNHSAVAPCVAVMVTLPPSSKLTLFPLTDAIAASEDVKVHEPFYEDVGASSVSEPVLSATVFEGNTPIFCVPGRT